MMVAMRWTALLWLPVLAAAAEIGGSQIRTVYVMPMAHGLDQFVANRLAEEHLFEVVADPARADAIFTDQLGQALVRELEKLHPASKPAVEEAQSDSENTEPARGETAAKVAAPTPSNEPPLRRLRTINTLEAPASTLGRGKGTLFLVDANTRAILWSVYEKPARSRPGELDRTARRIVSRLKQTLAGK